MLLLPGLFTVTDVSSQDCGACVAPGKWKQFMCHNLGAANTAADPFTPGWEIVGGYWQWGKKTMAAAGPTGAAPEFANEGDVSGWNGADDEKDSWSGTGKTDDDPCPAGYRIPEEQEWSGVLTSNTVRRTGVWVDSPSNYTTGVYIGDKLFLPASGGRHYQSGGLGARGSGGFYWSSTNSGSRGAWCTYFSEKSIFSNGYEGRSYALSVRCIAE